MCIDPAQKIAPAPSAHILPTPVKHCTAITDLVVVWSLCSVCTIMTKSKAAILYNT